jgi:Protein of unknown function (DUF3443)
VTFDVADAEQLLASNNAVFSNLGGPMPGGFDFGLPFFMGRRIFVAIAGQDTPEGPGLRRDLERLFAAENPRPA